MKSRQTLPRVVVGRASIRWRRHFGVEWVSRVRPRTLFPLLGAGGRDPRFKKNPIRLHGGSHMARMQWIGLSFLGLALGSVGCVPAEKYNAMKLAHDSAMERLAQADSNANAAKAESSAYKKQLDAIMASGNNQTAMVANLTQQLTDMQGRYSDLEARYNQAMQNTGVVQVLPEAVNNALTEFAQQNPDLVDFDAA